MGVAAGELVGDGVAHLREVELALLARDPGLEDDLEEQVTQLFLVVRDVPGLDGLDHLVRFLQQIGSQGAQRLLAVPGAAARIAQLVHDVEQPPHRRFRLAHERRNTTSTPRISGLIPC